MADDIDDTAGGESRDPDVTDTAGSDADGGASSDPVQAEGGASRDPAKRTDPTASDLDDALAVAMAPDGEVAKDKPEDEDGEKQADDGDTEGDEPEGKAKDDDQDEGDEEEGDEPEPAPYPELEPTEAERRALSKTANKRLDKLLELRRPAHFGEAVRAAAEANGFDGPMLRHWIETGGKVNKAQPEEAAQHLVDLAVTIRAGGPEKAKSLPPAEKARLLREMADKLSPLPRTEPEVITLPPELRDAVDAGTLEEEEAKQLAKARADKAKPKQPPAKPEEKAPAKTEERDQGEKPWFTEAEHAKGLEEAQKEFSKAAAKHGPDWKRISSEVIERVKARSAQIHPKAYAQLVRDQIDFVLAKRTKPAKTPPRSPVPSGSGKPEQKGEMNDEELLDFVINPK